MIKWLSVKEEFVEQYFATAKKMEHKTGIPAIFALAQSALETGWGRHTPGNMFFGIKIGSGKSFGGWNGGTQLIYTNEYIKGEKHRIRDYFRAYDTPYNSFLDWAGMLTKNPRYKMAMKARDDPEKFADLVAKAGYATDPNYAPKVKSTMKKIMELSLNTREVSKKRWLPIFGLVISCTLIIGGVLILKRYNNNNE